MATATTMPPWKSFGAASNENGSVDVSSPRATRPGPRSFNGLNSFTTGSTCTAPWATNPRWTLDNHSTKKSLCSTRFHAVQQSRARRVGDEKRWDEKAHALTKQRRLLQPLVRSRLQLLRHLFVAGRVRAGNGRCRLRKQISHCPAVGSFRHRHTHIRAAGRAEWFLLTAAIAISL